ncbi:aldehyde dehydrogenase family protein, partial [Stomatohabitans albus]
MDFDADLRSIQEARELAVRAKEAQKAFAMADQETVDRICEAMVSAAMANAARLGQLAHEETGFGNPIHKRLKNELAAQGVWDNIKDQKTCGEIRRDEAKRIVEFGAPVGVVLGLSPSTNPTATAIFKTLINVKARNAFILAPHPTAKKCTAEAIRVIAEAGEAAGMPKGLVSCVTEVHPSGTDELFHHYAVNLILATGGPGMVKAAHSAGKPAIGVGPGNVPVYVDSSASPKAAAANIVDSKSFDCSTICATEQAVFAHANIAKELREEMKAKGAHWLSKEEADKLASMMF